MNELNQRFLFICVCVCRGVDIAKYSGVGSSAIIIDAILMSCSLIFLFSASFSNPGIIPAQPALELARFNDDSNRIQQSKRRIQVPRREEVVVQGRLVNLKYCRMEDLNLFPLFATLYSSYFDSNLQNIPSSKMLSLQYLRCLRSHLG